MLPPHLTSADLAEAARSGTLDAGARLHIETCSRCRLRYESAKWSYTSIGGSLQRSIVSRRAIEPGLEETAASRDQARHARRDRFARGAAEEHLSEDRLLALVTDAVSAEDARSWERHLANCELCARRVAHLRHFIARREMAFDFIEDEALTSLPETRPAQRARLEVRPLPGQRELSLTLRTENEEPQQTRTEIVLPGAASVHLSASAHSGEARLDVMIEAGGAPAPNVAITLRSPSRRIAQALTGRDGRATFPLESGASHLVIATRPAWGIEIDL